MVKVESSQEAQFPNASQLTLSLTAFIFFPGKKQLSETAALLPIKQGKLYRNRIGGTPDT